MQTGTLITGDVTSMFDMGGYGAFVLPAYGITFLAIGGVALWSWLAWRSARAKLAALEARK